MPHQLKMFVYRLGRRLMHIAYAPGANAVEHDLRLEVAELRREVGRLKVGLSVERVKRIFQ